MKGKNLPTYQQLCQDVEEARKDLNAVEDVNSEFFAQLTEVYKQAKQARDAHAYNMKYITDSGHLLRL